MSTRTAKPKKAQRDLSWLQSCGLTVLTQTETADVLGCDQRTVSRAIQAGDLPGIRLGRRVMVPRLPLLALLEGRQSA